MVSATCVPSLDILEQQTTETALVEFINFLYVSIPLNPQFKLVCSTLLSVQDNPSLEGATSSLLKEALKVGACTAYLRVLSQGQMSNFGSIAGRNPDVMVCLMPYDGIAPSSNQWRHYMQKLVLRHTRKQHDTSLRFAVGVVVVQT